MQYDRRRVLFILAVLAIAAAAVYYFMNGLSGTLDVTATMDKSVYHPGDPFSLTVQSVSGISKTYVNTHPTSAASSSACGSVSGKCPYTVSAELEDVCNNVYLFVNTAAHGDGVNWSDEYDTWQYDEWDTWTGWTGYALWGRTDSSHNVVSESDLQPFMLAPRSAVTVDFYMWRASSGAAAYPVVAICVDSSSDVSVSYVSGGAESDSSYRSLSINGSTYYCRLFRVTASSGTSHVYIRVSNSSSTQFHKFYAITSNTCWTKRTFSVWTSYCNDSYTYSTSGFMNGIEVSREYMLYSAYSDAFSGGSSSSDGSFVWDGSSVSSVSPAVGHISTTATEQSAVAGVVLCPVQTCALSGGTSVSNVCISDWRDYRSDRSYYDPYAASFEVRRPATSVSLGAVTVSRTDDEYTVDSISVSGGSDFDRVVVKDSCTGSSRTLYPSSFSCQSTQSGTVCTYNDDIIFDSPMSGQISSSNSRSCSVTAELYVDGSKKDTDSRTVTVYAPYVQSLDAHDVSTNKADWSVTICGAYSKYEVYVDGTKVATKTVSPSTVGHCYAYNDSVTTDEVTPGTHTLEVKAYTSDGDEYSTRSDSFTANYTYTYAITGFTIQNSEYHVVGASSTSVMGTVDYSTSDPDGAYLAVYDGSTSVWSSNVGSGSGHKSWSADNISCGSHTFEARITPKSNHNDVKDSRSVSATVYCWSASIGPSGTVQVPSDGSNVLPTASVTVYYDVSVNPSTSYTTKVYWNSTEITDKFQPGSGHTAVATLTPDDVPMSCGDNVTLKLEVYHNGTLITTKTSNITLQCVEQYVIIKSPTDGSKYDTFGSASPDPDFRLPIAVDYAGGDTLSFYINNSPVSPASADCAELNLSADACYTLSGSQLQTGDNTLRVELNSGSTMIADDSVTFTVYAWSFAYMPTYGSDVATLSVKEYGSHAQSCQISFPELNVNANMLYSSADAQWDYSVDKATYDGEEFNITCYSPTGAQVYSYTDTVNFSSGGGGGGGSGGGSGGGASTAKPEAPEKPEVLPFWPDYATVSSYQWSIIDEQAFKDTMSSAAVSTSLVCVQPNKGVVSAKYCPVSVSSVPTTQDGLSQVIEQAVSAGCSAVPVKYVGDYQCVDMRGPGIYEFALGADRVRILVAGSSVNYTVIAGVAISALVIVALVYAYSRGYI